MSGCAFASQHYQDIQGRDEIFACTYRNSVAADVRWITESANVVDLFTLGHSRVCRTLPCIVQAVICGPCPFGDRFVPLARFAQGNCICNANAAPQRDWRRRERPASDECSQVRTVQIQESWRLMNASAKEYDSTGCTVKTATDRMPA
jgi:hypothetical protein